MKILVRKLWKWTWRSSLITAVVAAAVIGICWQIYPFPEDLLEAPPSSPLVFDRHGRVLAARVARDEQWRLPIALDQIHPHLVEATLAVEDSRFHQHPGVDSLAVMRAFGHNLIAGEIVSGASTLTMQVCKMLDPSRRTLSTKLKESLRALQLERRIDKEEILELYLNLAPYGGNVRGAEAASRLWFGKSASELSLAEAALLAGLPQSPSFYCPDRHPQAAKRRRNEVLRRMFEEGYIDESTCRQTQAQALHVFPLTGAGRRLGQSGAEHWNAMVLQARAQGGGTTLDLEVQRAVVSLALQHVQSLNQDLHLAIVVIDLAGSEIRALLGSPDFWAPRAGQVNGATAWRSPGSALKPFFYGAAFDRGRLVPSSLVPDQSLQRQGWRPENFDSTVKGWVSAEEALQRSLNLPAIRILEALGVEAGVGVLEAAGLVFAEEAAHRGGLALATGAVEVRLVDLVNAYACLGRGGLHLPWRMFTDQEPVPPRRVLGERSCRQLDHVLSCRNRPAAGLADALPGQSAWFMWKTGTSAGRRDAVAVGHNGRFAIGVWIGDVSGAGHPELVGRQVAEPLLVRLFQHPRLAGEVEPIPLEKEEPLRKPWFQGPEPLRIDFPASEASYLCSEETLALQVQVRPQEEFHWFLNGRMLGQGAQPAPLLELKPGRHRLRAVAKDGRTTQLGFEVRRLW
ncbi:MAG: penicillin-binding protein 1C [Planctomycetota bacterium]|nr:MAG: penicillin-binding protein 1C [Planctomycetota bacterium]